MKISLITMHNVHNYGSVLQTYATVKVFEKLGHTTEVVDYYRRDNLPSHAVEKALNSQKVRHISFLWKKSKLMKRLAEMTAEGIIKFRRRCFKRFTEKYIPLSPKTYCSADELNADPPISDIYVTGSDQVWNSIWNQGYESPYFLEFAPKGSLKAAFSASIGREQLDEWEKQPMRAALSQYSAISVRESSAVKVLDDLGIHGAVHVLDPTLMLRAEDWLQIATPVKTPKKYILVYQLNRSKEFSRYVREFAGYKGLPVVRISYSFHELTEYGRVLICPDVTQFITLFANAEYVITDSFHATAFSLNFKKKFASLLPERFGTRIRSILELTGTTDHIPKDGGDLSAADRPYDGDAVVNIFRAEREKALDFLRNAFDRR